MKGEFSRFSFDPRKRFTGVLQQQGRVGLDSDWNEWVETVLHRLSVETLDVIGKAGRPKHAPGYRIALSGNPPVFTISDGRLYVGGLLAESFSPDGNGTQWGTQIEWPIPDKNTWTTAFGNSNGWPGLDLSVAAKAPTLFYAEVWNRHITALNDEAERSQASDDAAPNQPDWTRPPETGTRVRERALGGPDTCTRLMTVAQVKAWTLPQNAQDCDAACAALEAALPSRTSATLRVDVKATPPVKSPCDEPLAGGYAGPENRTYRVEIHDPGPAGTATFKWSSENGAFTLRINETKFASKTAGATITLQSIGKDQTVRLKDGDWVEVCGEETELGMFRNSLAQVNGDPIAGTDGTWTVKLSKDAVIPGAPFLRRWDADVQTIQLNSSFPLDTIGQLGVTFFDNNGGTGGKTYFHSQDYWVWAARTDTRDIEPEDLSHVPQPPRGIERYYACLAIIQIARQGQTWTTVRFTSCTPEFPPLTELETGGCCCCVVRVGDGKTTTGDFNSLADAFAAAPNTGAGFIVCVERGVHIIEKPIEILQDNVILRGCGHETVIQAPAGAFVIQGHNRISFSGITIESQSAPAIAAVGVSELSLRDSRIRMSLSHLPSRQINPEIIAQEKQKHEADFGKPVAIAEKKMAPRKAANKPASASDTKPLVEAANVAKENVPTDQLTFVGFNAGIPALVLQGWLIDITGNEIRGAFGAGGIAIIAGSGQVVVRNNNIHKSALPAIDFGFVGGKYLPRSVKFEFNYLQSVSRDIVIAGNQIRDIDTVAISQAPTSTAAGYVRGLEAAKQLQKSKLASLPAGALIDLTIENNLITNCGIGATTELAGASESRQEQLARAQAERERANGGAAILLTAVERLRIQRNRIVRNGLHDPVYAGILITVGEGVIIRDNVISENGRTLHAQPTTSGGIRVQFAMPEDVLQTRQNSGDVEGWPALAILDNVINSLNGPAIFTKAMGSIHVSRNTITSRHLGRSNIDASVVIADAGSSLDALARYTSELKADTLNTPVYTPLSEIGGMIQFSDNHITYIPDPESEGPAVFVRSRDDVSFTNNQIRVMTQQNRVLINSFVTAPTVRVIGNRFVEQLSQQRMLSCLGQATYIVGMGNEATNCLRLTGTIDAQVQLNIVINSQFCKQFTEFLAGRQQ